MFAALVGPALPAAMAATVSCPDLAGAVPVAACPAEGLSGTYRTRAECMIEGAADCSAKPAACKASCE